MAGFKIGDLITFGYEAENQGKNPPNVRWGGRKVTDIHDKFPQVLVLHTNWNGLVHGLNFNYLTEDEINTIRMLIDPMFEMKFRNALQRKNPTAYKELERLIRLPRQQRSAKITSPYAFYRGVIRPFIISRGWDPYRRYKPGKMKSVRVLQTAAHMTGEQSFAKWKREQDEITKALQQAQNKAQTPQEKSSVEKMKKDFERNKSISQRSSILRKFADWIGKWRGPRFR